VPIYLSFDEDRPVMNLTTGPVGDAPETAMRFTRSTGAPPRRRKAMRPAAA
jgi:hypothetical protein